MASGESRTGTRSHYPRGVICSVPSNNNAARWPFISPPLPPLKHHRDRQLLERLVSKRVHDDVQATTKFDSRPSTPSSTPTAATVPSMPESGMRHVEYRRSGRLTPAGQRGALDIPCAPRVQWRHSPTETAAAAVAIRR